jgi:cell shape-determining protein MreD
MIRSLPWLPALLVGAVLATLIGATMATRLPYPYDLEWMEGAIVAHAWRLQRGLPLYPEPGPDWIPFVYPPGYPALLALAGESLGIPVGRAVSLVGTALGLLAIAWTVGRHAVGPHRIIAGVLAALVFLGTWVDVGAFHDLARPDALAVGLLLAAMALGFERGLGPAALAGVLLAAAYLVKHPMAAFGPAIAVTMWARGARLRDVGVFLAAAIVPALTATAWLQVTTGGTFLTWLLAVPASHDAIWHRVWPGTPWEVGSALPLVGLTLAGAALLATLPEQRRRFGLLIAGAAMGFAAIALGARDGELTLGAVDALVRGLPAFALGTATRVRSAGPIATGIGMATLVGLALAALAGLGRLVGPDRAGALRRLAPAAAWGLTAITLATAMRGHHGGYVNVYLPLYAVAATGFGFVLAAGAARWPRGGPWALSALAAGQLGWSLARTNPDALAPTPLDRQTGDAIVARLKLLDGSVWSPVAPWLAVQAGHPPGPHLVALWDVAFHPRGPWPDTTQVFERAIVAGRWDFIVDSRKSMGFGVEGTRLRARRLALHSQAFWPKTGWRARPELVHELKLRDEGSRVLRAPGSPPPAPDGALPDAPAEGP